MAGNKNNVVTLGTKGNDKERSEQLGYSGPDLVPGSYRVETGKVWLLKESKKGEPMISMPLNVAEAKGSPKAKYNGATIWQTVMLAGAGLGMGNSFLEACGIDPAKVHGGKAKLEDTGKDFQKITAIAGVTMEGNLLTVALKKNKDGYLNVSAYAAFDPDAVADEEADEDDDDVPWDDEDESDDSDESDDEDDEDDF